MNDILYVYLRFDTQNPSAEMEVEGDLEKMDDLLKEHGWEYSGFRNMYRPVKGTDPDATCYDARMEVKKGGFPEEL